MKYIVLVFTFLSLNVSSTEFEKRGSRVILKSKSCESIHSDLPALEEWTKRSGRSTCDISKVLVSGNPCEADISQCIPAHVLKYQGETPDVSSPNCWNLSMVMSGLIPNMRYSSPKEMAFFMNSPLCRLLEYNEDRMPGDVGAIRAKGGAEVHGFIHVSDNLAYSKNGYKKTEPYKLQKSENVLNLYGVSSYADKCKQNRKPADDSCESYVEYFRCKSLDEYLSQGEDEISNNLQDIILSADKIECRVSEYLMDATSINSQATTLAVHTTEILLHSLQKEFSNYSSKSPKEKYVLGMLKVRLDSLSQNIDGSLGRAAGNNENIRPLIRLKELLDQSVSELSSAR